MMGFGFGFGGIMMLLVTLVIIGICVALVAALFPHATSGGSTTGAAQSGAGLQSAADILKQRYARGEISKEQFEQMKRDVGA